jgi:hypothetical protein
MISNDTVHSIDPEWADVAMNILPQMYRTGDVTGNDDCVFVYATTFSAVGAELKRGATAQAIREQTRRILQYIDGTDRPGYDKEHFAALFARAVDDALEGRSPCVLH